MVTPLPRPVYQAIGDVLTHPRFHPFHRRLYRWAGGWGILGRALGMDMLLVTMRGRRTGETRTVPLGAVADGDAWVLIGSNAGRPRTPGWVHNLRADAAVTVEHRRTRRAFRAREAEGAERDRLWAHVTTAYPGYQVYEDRTERRIALFVLERVHPAASDEAR